MIKDFTDLKKIGEANKKPYGLTDIVTTVSPRGS